MSAALEPRIAAYIAERMPGAAAVAVDSLTRISGGASRETYRFRLTWTEDGRALERKLILRRGTLYRAPRLNPGAPDAPILPDFGIRIDRFELDRLTVDKGRPDALVSFCETGVKKIGPTTFEVRRQNFMPTRDIDIMIVRTGE